MTDKPKWLSDLLPGAELVQIGSPAGIRLISGLIAAAERRGIKRAAVRAWDVMEWAINRGELDTAIHDLAEKEPT